MRIGILGCGHVGGEIPAALGVRMARPETGEVYVLIGDGTYLMGGASELVTARQHGLDVKVLLIENGGYQSIHGLQRKTTGTSFGLESRDAEGELVEVDYLANARSLGCSTWRVTTEDELRHALRSARHETGPAVIVVRVQSDRYPLGSECWWDVGVPEVSQRAETMARAEEQIAGRAHQRHYSQSR